MIVTCPNCATRYLVDPRAVGAAGRHVRCARCAHTWHYKPPAEALAALAGAEPLGAPRIDIPRPASGDWDAGAERRIQLPAIAKPRRRPWVTFGWIVLLLAVAGIVGGGVWARDEVTRLWPPSLKLYRLVGLAPPPLPGEGLRVSATPRRDVENGVPRIVIEGDVVNISTEVLTVPKLAVLLKDPSDRVVQSWIFSVSEERLLPGASVAFTTSVSQPNESATGMEVRFVGSGDGK